MLLRREYQELLPDEGKQRAEKLAAVVKYPSEFLWSIRDQERFKTDFQSSPGEKLTYHVPCYPRARAVGFRGRERTREIPNLRIKTTMECRGHDGTYALKVKGFEASKKVGQKVFDGVQSAAADIWYTDCPPATIQFQQHAGVKPMRPMSILARAYRAGGFPTPLPLPDESTAKCSVNHVLTQPGLVLFAGCGFECPGTVGT